MHRNQQSQPTRTSTSRRVAVARVDLASGLPERLALYVFGVLCLIAFLLESPVPMAIAP
jgi:hypothetical protein